MVVMHLVKVCGIYAVISVMTVQAGQRGELLYRTILNKYDSYSSG